MLQPSWEPEEHVPPDLIQLFAQQNSELFNERTSAQAAASASSFTELGLDYEIQATPRPLLEAARQRQQEELNEHVQTKDDVMAHSLDSSGIAGAGGGWVSPQREAVGAGR